MIALEDVTVRVGGFQLQHISFAVPKGGYAVLMGKTGSGKTTLLETICGLRAVTSGRIRLDDRDVTALAPAQREIGYVPQDGALFGHLAVRQQLAFPLVVRRWASDKIEQRVQEVADVLGIPALLNRSIHGLSGGEGQRVALGRALSFRPRVLCLDEPLSALDSDTRIEMCEVLESVQKQTGVTVLHITHHPAEAERLATILFKLKEGQISSTTPQSQHQP